MDAERLTLRGAVLGAEYVLVLTVAAVTGFGATVAAATLWDRPSVLLSTGLVAAAGVGWAGLQLLCRPWRRRRRAVLLGVVLVVVIDATALLTPLGDPRTPPAPVTNLHDWNLRTGSRLAYVRQAAEGPRRSTPIVVLHGGPGIPDMSGDAAFFGQLTALGYDVYVYDQLGSGRSTRLTDPVQYGKERDVADLEEIRLAIGADRLVLIGHSYGGSLAAHYLAAHPDHVEKMILSSPAPLDPADSSGDQATARLKIRDRLRLYLTVLAPRALLGYALLQVNPSAAHSYLPDAEGDARNDKALSLADQGLHCRAPQERHRVHGSGFYALQYPQSATAPPDLDVRSQLFGRQTPVLLLKGSCDYLSWQSAMDYRHALPRTTLLYLPGAGHNLYLDRPTDVMAAARAFLTDSELPWPPYTNTNAPDDYQAR